MVHRRGFPLTDGAAGLARALATPWPDVPTQRCAVRKHRNLLARAPDALHGAVSAGHIDVIDAATPKEGEAKR